MTEQCVNSSTRHRLAYFGAGKGCGLTSMPCQQFGPAVATTDSQDGNARKQCSLGRSPDQLVAPPLEVSLPGRPRFVVAMVYVSLASRLVVASEVALGELPPLIVNLCGGEEGARPRLCAQCLGLTEALVRSQGRSRQCLDKAAALVVGLGAAFTW